MLHYMVDAAGVEPAVPEAADLQSTGVTNFPTHPYKLNTLQTMSVPALSRRYGKVCIKTNCSAMQPVLIRSQVEPICFNTI